MELPDQEFKTTMTDVLWDLKGKVDNMQEQIGNVCKEIEILKKKERASERNAKDHKQCDRNESL